MKKILMSLLMCLVPFYARATVNPPYAGIQILIASGTATQFLSGRFRVAKSSLTADTSVITIDGLTGNIYANGGIVVSSNALPNGTSWMMYVGTTPFIYTYTPTNLSEGLNLFMGVGAGNPNLDTFSGGASGNTFFGNGGLSFLLGGNPLTANYNTGIGYQAMYSMTSGYSNDAHGWRTLFSNTTGDQNAAFGQGALTYNTSGSSNTALGDSAMYTNTTGGNNTSVGWANMGGNNVGTMTGNANSSLGASAQANITSGSNNTAVGYASMDLLTTGLNNTSLGENALASIISGNTNVAIGMQSLQNDIANSNTAIGYQSSMANTSGTNNVSSGYGSQISNTVGNNNTSVGSQSLGANVSGYSNTALGALSGYTSNSSNANVTGSSNTFIGYNAGPSTPTEIDNATCIGANCQVSVSNALILGGSGVRIGIGTSSPAVQNLLEVNGQTNLAGSTISATAVTLNAAATFSIGGSTVDAAGPQSTFSVVSTTGCTSAGLTINSARYHILGKMMHFTFDASCTSNSTSFTTSFPYSLKNGSDIAPCIVEDNGTFKSAFGFANSSSNSGIVTFFIDGSNGTNTWTASGTKRVICTGDFELK